MTRIEARRVACLITSSIVDNFIISGDVWNADESIGENACHKIEKELQHIADRLDERGRRNEGTYTSVSEAVRVATSHLTKEVSSDE